MLNVEVSTLRRRRRQILKKLCRSKTRLAQRKADDDEERAQLLDIREALADAYVSNFASAATPAAAAPKNEGSRILRKIVAKLEGDRKDKGKGRAVDGQAEAADQSSKNKGSSSNQEATTRGTEEEGARETGAGAKASSRSLSSFLKMRREKNGGKK